MNAGPSRRLARAFTLIEVMVALAIFAFAGLVLSAAYVNVLNAQETALRRDDTAPALAQVRASFRAQPDRALVEGWNDLALPDDWSARWRATLTPTTIADLFDVVLEIELTDPRGQRQVRTEACRLLRPTWSQPGDREALRAAARTKLSERTYQ